MTATFFPNGISRENENALLKQIGYVGFGVGDILEMADDFLLGNTAQYQVNVGSGNGQVVQDTDAPFGVAQLQSDDGTLSSNGNQCSLRPQGTGLVPGGGGPIVFKTRVGMSGAALTNDVQHNIGLIVAEAASGTLNNFANFIGLHKPDTSAQWDLRMRVASTNIQTVNLSSETNAILTALTDEDDFVEIIIAHKNGVWSLYVNNALAASITADNMSALLLQPMWDVYANGGASANNTVLMNIDYYSCAQQIVR